MRFLLILTVFVVAFAAACRNNANNNPAQMNRSSNTSRANANAQATVNANQSNAAQTTAQNGEIPVYGYEVVRTYKHDPNAFTEGLFFHNGYLYESVGQNGDSAMRKVELETGAIKAQHTLDKKYFGEGATVLNDKIYQLTWQEGRCFVYDAATLEPVATFAYEGEGWGITTDGTNLIMGDGSDVLTFRSPTDFRTVRKINVTYNGKPLYLINELEYINGEIWSNIWHSEDTATMNYPNIGKPNYIARINPADGKVVGWIDLKNISPDDVARDPENTLNGIAYDQAANRIFVTGKKWRKLFEIKVK